MMGYMYIALLCERCPCKSMFFWVKFPACVLRELALGLYVESLELCLNPVACLKSAT